MITSQDTEFWLQGAANGELLIQQCTACLTLRHPPRPMCPTCTSLEWSTLKAEGHGSVFSFVIYRHQPQGGIRVPYVVALIDLPEGVRLVGNVVECAPEDVRIGLQVEVVFVADSDDAQTLPQWRPADVALRIGNG